MTIQSQTTRVDYTGNGATTNFPVPFYWLQDTDLLVIRTDNAHTPPTVATLALTTDYVVTGSGNQLGGSITTTVAPTATQKLSILRNVPFTQLTHYVPNDPFPAASHEQALDKLTMETQQLNEGLSRSITLPPNATGLSTNLPLPAANNMIGWNQAANALQNVDPTTIATSVTYGNAVADKFNGDGTTVNFNLSANPGGVNNLDVSIGGVTQRPGIDYTWTAGTTLTFTTAPPSGTNNVLVRYTQALPIGTAAAGNVAFDNNTLDQQFLRGVNRVVDSIAALRGLSKTLYTRAFVTGYYAAGDGGGGAYWYDPTDTTSADNGGTIIVASDGGRWKLQITGSVSVRQFGAKGDGLADDAPAFLAAVTALNNIYVPFGTYRFSTTVQLPNKNIRLFGEGTLTSTAALTLGLLCQQNRGVKTTINGIFFTGASVGFYRNAIDITAGSPYNDEYYEVEITGCSFIMSAGVYGIYLFGARETTISNCYFETGNGINTITAINVQVIGCTWKNCGTGISNTQNSQGLRIIGGTSLGCATWLTCNGTDGTFIADTMADYNDVTVTAYNVTDFYVANSYMSSRTKTAAIAFSADTGKFCSNIRIINCQFLNNYLVLNPTYAGKDCHAIYLTRCSLITIQNCIIMNYTSAGVIMVTSDHVYIFGNSFNGDSSYPPNYNIQEPQSDCTYVKIYGNNFSGNVALGQLQVSTNDISSNHGIITENVGTGSIAAGGTSVVVNHGLYLGPQAAGIQIMPVTAPSGTMWVSNITGTSFTLNVSAAPAGTFSFQWRAKVSLI